MPRSANARVFIETAILVWILLLLTAVVPGLAHQPKPEVSESDEKSGKNNTSKLRNMNARQTRHSIWLGDVQDLPRRHAVERFLQELRGITTLRHLNCLDFQWRIRCSCVSTPVVDLRGFLLKLCQLQRFQRISVPTISESGISHIGLCHDR